MAYIAKASNAGGMSTITRYVDMLAGNTVFNPWAPSGAYDSIASTTLTSSGSVTFSSIPQTYTHLQIRFISTLTASQDYNFMRFNGSSTGSTYYGHYLQGNGTSATAGAPNVPNRTDLLIVGNTPPTASTNTYNAGIIDILDYTSTTKNKVIRTINGFDANGSGIVSLISGLWLNTSAITQIDFAGYGTGLQQYTSVALYGIKGN